MNDSPREIAKNVSQISPTRAVDQTPFVKLETQLSPKRVTKRARIVESASSSSGGRRKERESSSDHEETKGDSRPTAIQDQNLGT